MPRKLHWEFENCSPTSFIQNVAWLSSSSAVTIGSKKTSQRLWKTVTHSLTVKNGYDSKIVTCTVVRGHVVATRNSGVMLS